MACGDSNSYTIVHLLRHQLPLSVVRSWSFLIQYLISTICAHSRSFDTLVRFITSIAIATKVSISARSSSPHPMSSATQDLTRSSLSLASALTRYSSSSLGSEALSRNKYRIRSACSATKSASGRILGMSFPFLRHLTLDAFRYLWFWAPAQTVICPCANDQHTAGV